MAEDSKRESDSVARKEFRLKHPLGIGIVLLVVAAELLLFSKRDAIHSESGYVNIPKLPRPEATLSADEQAMYWTYALYDSAKFRSRFHIQGAYSIGRTRARHELESLLPRVSRETLAEISSYGAMAFNRAKGGKRE